VVPRSLKNLVLFLASLVFYAWGEPVYVVLMLFSTLVDYTCGRLVSRFIEREDKKHAKIFVGVSMCINLALLGFFKYGDFIIGNINSLLKTAIPAMNLGLPIGISFYTFQTMSYTVDVYRKDAKVQKNIISFGAYVALFPQLIAGPIVRFQTIAEQLNHRVHTLAQTSYGITRFMTGLGKKVLLANNIGMVWTEIAAYAPERLSTVTAWIGVLAFSLQLYFDFSGYSDMAIGLGEIFGFHFLENFNYPYMSKSITEFWRRWHISLGTWFREYVYIPLGGNRKGKVRQLFNIAVVWFLTGLWHGAAWNFVLWGLYFCVFLMLEKTFFLKVLNKIPAIIGHVYTLIVVAISWAIFSSGDMAYSKDYFKAMFGMGSGGLIDDRGLYLLTSNAVLLVILLIAATNLPSYVVNRVFKPLTEGVNRQVAVVEGTGVYGMRKRQVLYTILQCVFIVGIFVWSVAYLVDSSFNPFLYFRF
jgi:alginate O-acetyltransferase complex protein AlgI